MAPPQPNDAGAGWQPLAPPRRHEQAFVTTGFTRLARVQVLASMSDALIAMSLAGSLFFSIPTGEARGRVALYLFLTIAPFAVVGPVMGPALDRMPGGRRLLIVLTGFLRVVVCLLMARFVDSLLLFPLAFAALVAGKAHLIARSALVPTVVDSDDELVEANSKLSLLSGAASFLAAVPGALLLRVVGPEAVLVLAAVAGFAQALTAFKLPATQVAAEPPDATEQQELRGEGLVLAAEAMGLLRGVVGFLTFLLAFALRGGGDDSPVPVGLALGRAVRDAAGFELSATSGTAGGAPTWHFGVVLAMSVAGALAGAALAPRLRDLTSEENILQGVLATTTGVALVAAAFGGLPGAAVLALAVGAGSGAGKLAFDSIVQRDAPDANRGRSFALFETRFQLIWVVGGFVPVVVPMPARLGFLVVAGAAGFALFSYVGGVRRNRGRPRPHPRQHADVPPTTEPLPVDELPAAEIALVGPPPAPAPPPEDDEY